MFKKHVILITAAGLKPPNDDLIFFSKRSNFDRVLETRALAVLVVWVGLVWTMFAFVATIGVVCNGVCCCTNSRDVCGFCKLAAVSSTIVVVGLLLVTLVVVVVVVS